MCMSSCPREGRISIYLIISCAEEGSLKIREEQACRAMRWNLQPYKCKHLLWRPSLAFGKMTRSFEAVSSLRYLVPTWATFSDHLYRHAQICFFHWGGSFFLGQVLLCVQSSGILMSMDFTKEMFFIPPAPFMVRQDWIVFANQSCFANFLVYMGIYDSLSLKRNGIGVCLNLLRFSDWFCSHRTSF